MPLNPSWVLCCCQVSRLVMFAALHAQKAKCHHNLTSGGAIQVYKFDTSISLNSLRMFQLQTSNFKCQSPWSPPLGSCWQWRRRRWRPSQQRPEYTAPPHGGVLGEKLFQSFYIISVECSSPAIPQDPPKTHPTCFKACEHKTSWIRLASLEDCLGFSNTASPPVKRSEKRLVLAERDGDVGHV